MQTSEGLKGPKRADKRRRSRSVLMSRQQGDGLTS